MQELLFPSSPPTRARRSLGQARRRAFPVERGQFFHGSCSAYIKRSICAFEALATLEAAFRFRRWRYRGGPPLRLVISVIPRSLRSYCRPVSLMPSLLLTSQQALRLAAQEPIRTERKQQDSKHGRVAKALIRMPRRAGLLASSHLLLL